MESETSKMARQILYVIVFFYLSKSLMVIAYILYTVLFKDVVNLTLFFFFFFFFAVFNNKVNIINIT